MARLHLAVSVLVSLLSLLSLGCCCTKGSGSVCKTAPFFPGHNLVGEGYDLVTLKRKGAYLIDVKTYMNPDGTCQTFTNPFQGNQVQKLPLSTVDLRALTRCTTRVYSTMQTSVSKVVSSLTNQDNYDWKVGLSHEKYGSLEIGGTKSNLYNFVTARAREDKFIYSVHHSSCTHYSYRVSNNPPLSTEFRNDVNRLPSIYNPSTKSQYRRLINTYGTHYIRQAYLGGRVRRLTAVRTCLSSLNGFSSSKAHYCLSLGINIALGKYKIPASFKSCSKFLHNKTTSISYNHGMYLHQTEVVGGKGWTGEFSLLQKNSQGYDAWLKSLKDHPDVVRQSLRLMSDLVPDSKKKSQVKTAIEDYLKENGISKTSGKVCGINCCPKKAFSGRLVVTIVRAWKLKGDFWGRTESYAKMWYGNRYHRTRMIRSNYPTWNARYDLGQVDTHLGLKIEVWDEDWGRDDRLGSCVKYLQQGTNSFTCYAKRGGVLVTYTLTCDDHLTGVRCNQYKPTPQ